MKYQKWNIGAPREEDVALLREAGYPYLMALVLAARGIASPETAAEFLDRDRKLTLSPMLMRDMDKAVAWAKRMPELKHCREVLLASAADGKEGAGYIGELLLELAGLGGETHGH